MKKPTVILMTFLLMILLCPFTASASVSVSAATVQSGGSVTISGTVSPNTNVVVKITDEDGGIVFFDAVTADASGGYSVQFMVPEDITASTLTVTAGSGTDVDTAVITIAGATPIPTTAPTPTSTPAHTAAPTAKASPGPVTSTPEPAASPTPVLTASPTPLRSASPAPSPGQSSAPASTTGPAQTAMPSPAPTQAAMVVRPVTVHEDEQKGTVILGIAVSDLPADASAVQTPDGRIVYVKDAVDGILYIEVARDSLGDDGKIEMAVIDSAQAPLATVYMQVLDLPEAGRSFPWWIVAFAVLAVVPVIVWAVVRIRRMSATPRRSK